MSKTWYPVISYENCIECGSCFTKCAHGVYELKASCPAVVQPEDCVQGCHGCGNLCPVGAIEYVGDNTGWVPPGKTVSEAKADCCGGNNGGSCSGSGCCG